MYLFESSKDEIKVYGFWPKRFGRNVIYFKDAELDCINPNNRIYKAETNMDFFPLNLDNIEERMAFDNFNFEKSYFFKIEIIKWFLAILIVQMFTTL